MGAIEDHIVNYGVTEFIVGNYGAFDRLAAKAVIKAKMCNPKITLSLLLPYHPQNGQLKHLPGLIIPIIHREWKKYHAD